MSGQRQKGFSLLELTIVLAVTGMVGLVTWQLIPASRLVAGGDPIGQQLHEAQEAVEGFALLRSRLPCPAATHGNGLENCAVTTIGELPWRTLGVSPGDSPLRYGVYRSGTADLAQATNTFMPSMPVITTLPAGYTPNQINGLDLCQALRTAGAAPSASPVGLDAGGVPVAYALAHPGANRHFDGANAGTGFALPGTPVTSEFDDHGVATGLGELSTRLGCVTRMAAATASARSAFAAFDLDRNAAAYSEFRNFVYDVRSTNRKLAKSAVVLATLDLAIAVGASASAVSVASNSAGVGTLLVIGSVAAVTAATAGVVASAVLLVTAQTAEDLADRQKSAAQVLRVQSTLDYQTAFANAAAVDRKGLMP